MNRNGEVTRMKFSTLFAAAGLILVVPINVGVAWAQEAPSRPPVTKHDLEGRDQCLMCHTAGAIEAVPDAPASHADRTNETCKWCHAPGASMQTTDPPTITHDLEGRDQCLMCHTPGVMEAVPDAPASHEDRTNQHCRLCHNPAGG